MTIMQDSGMVAVYDTDTDIEKSIHGIKLTNSFSTYKEAVQFALEEDILNDKSGSVNGIIDALPEYFTKPNHSDSSVGGNDAINPYWQFGIDDDIIHPVTSIDNGLCEKGMGRVYSENYDQNQQILWLSMGVPKFVNLKDFYSDAANEGMSNLMNHGDFTIGDITFQVGKFITDVAKNTAKIAFAIPLIVPIGIYHAAKWIINDPTVSKYYEFKSSMIVYYRMVNIILSHLAVGMGLYGDKSVDGLKNMYSNISGVPEIMKYGPDIFTIMNKRVERAGNGNEIKTTDDLMEALGDKKEESSIFKQFVGGLIGGALGATEFVGLKVEKSTNTSESVSNTSGPSPLKEKLNGIAANAREKKFVLGGGTGLGVVDGLASGIGGLIKGITTSLAGAGTVELITGNGYYDIPDVWQNSTFTKSYSFNVQLRARYGDPLSIYQSIYIPLALLLAAALPRGIGTNMYTSPFIIRGFCKGMFSVPVGIIESMNIKRGAPEFGWSADTLPTAVDIDISIKDLSPAMFLTIIESSFFGSIVGIERLKRAFEHNTVMHEYLSTLSGLGIQERIHQVETMRRKLIAGSNISKHSRWSPHYWGRVFGSSTIPRALGRISPWSMTPNN